MYNVNTDMCLDCCILDPSLVVRQFNPLWAYFMLFTAVHTFIHTQGVTGGMCQTSGECSLKYTVITQNTYIRS